MLNFLKKIINKALSLFTNQTKDAVIVQEININSSSEETKPVKKKRTYKKTNKDRKPKKAGNK